MAKQTSSNMEKSLENMSKIIPNDEGMKLDDREVMGGCRECFQISIFAQKRSNAARVRTTQLIPSKKTKNAPPDRCSVEHSLCSAELVPDTPKFYISAP